MKPLSSGGKRSYFHCATQGCERKLTIDFKGESGTRTESGPPHNHAAPENPPLLPSVKKEMKEKLKSGV